MNSAKETFNKIRIVIVGSGLIGKFNAVELSKHGFQITLIDPNENLNSINAALGIMMGKVYQKRKGRSWELRKTSLKMWPIWINLLKKMNPELIIEKPLIQLTTDIEKFEKMNIFVKNNSKDNIKILNKTSEPLNYIQSFFSNYQLQGLISYEDGRINPKILLESLDLYIKKQQIRTIKNRVTNITNKNNMWISELQNGEEIKSEIIILCNSLDSLKLINSYNYGIKLRPVLGQAIEIIYNNEQLNFLSLPKHLNINGKNLIPIAKNKIIIGSTDEYKNKPDNNKIQELMEFIDEKPNWLKEENISRKWFGIRSRPDGEPSPILKSLEKGLILCSGFYKNGILLAPACSAWISEEIKKHI